jgi:hypothetical protein
MCVLKRPSLLEQIARRSEAGHDERERRALVRSFNYRVPFWKPGTSSLRWPGRAASASAQSPIRPIQPCWVSNSPQLRRGRATLPSSRTRRWQSRTVPPPVLEKQVDKTFRAIPHTVAGRGVSYAANGGLRVDFLPHNEGREPVRPRRPAAPALQTDAQLLRFLDFLIHEPEPAATCRHLRRGACAERSQTERPDLSAFRPPIICDQVLGSMPGVSCRENEITVCRPGESVAAGLFGRLNRQADPLCRARSRFLSRCETRRLSSAPARGAVGG